MSTNNLLNDLFEYNDGNLFWKIKISDKTKVGKITGSLCGNYIATKFYGKRMYNHRIIFMMHYGYLPKEIDHIDGNKFNNKIENLRPATKQKNMRNVFGIKSSTGHKNVSLDKRSNSYVVRIFVNNVSKHIGNFKNLELADLVAHEARDKYYGRFANHGY